MLAPPRLLLAAALGATISCGRLLGSDEDDRGDERLPEAAGADAAMLDVDPARGAEGASDPLDGAASADARSPARVFVTSDLVAGFEIGQKLAGVCETARARAGLTGTFVPWVFTSSRPVISELTEKGPFLLVGTGELVANDFAALTSGQLAAPINRDENGAFVQDYVWTGKQTRCNEWTQFDLVGTAGWSLDTDAHWESSEDVACELYFHVYCFQSD